MRQQTLLRCGIIAVLLSALAVRMLLFYRSLQYDELWSWQFFAPLNIRQILFDLSLPNNHPVNTLFIKTISAITDDLFAIRIFSLICSMAMIPAVYFAVSVWSDDRKTGIFSALFCVFSAPFIVYSTLARGYMPQAFFFALTAAGMACFSEKYIAKHSITGAVLVLAGGIGTIISVPTGIVFLAGLAAACLIRCRKMPPRPLIAVLGCGAIIAAAYYLAVYKDLTTATKWSIATPPLIQAANILAKTAAGAVLASITAAIISPWKTLPLFVIPAIVLLSGVFTGFGPERTYIIFAGVFAVTAAITAARFADRKNWLLSGAVVLLFAAGQIYNVKNYILPDWKSADVPTYNTTTICVYPANSGYPILWNHGEEFLNKYHANVGKSYLDSIRVYAPQGVFNGMDSSFGEKNVATTLKGTPGNDHVLGTYHTYKLEPYSEKHRLEKAFIIAYPKSLYKFPAPENSLRLNPWFEQSTDRTGSCALYFSTTPPSPDCGGYIFVIK